MTPKQQRKQWKAAARRSVRAHYWLFLALCLLAALIGAEFTSALFPLQTAEEELDVPTSSVATIRSGAELMNSDVVRLVVWDLVQGDLAAGRAAVADYRAAAAQETGPLAHQKGVLAAVSDRIFSGQFVLDLFDRAGQHLSYRAEVVVLVVLALVFQAVLMFLIKDCYVILVRRAFLQGRVYESLPLGSLTFFLLRRPRRWLHAAWTMGVLFVYRTLWSLTLIAIPIKHYSYFLVPYLMAEDPDLRARDAIGLSRAMMDGHKWECFRLGLSFWPWYLLDWATLGLSAVLYTNAYRTATYAEFYVARRTEAKAAGLPHADALDDDRLFARPDPALVLAAYPDVAERLDAPLPGAERIGGGRRFLSRWLGVMPLGTAHDLACEAEMKREADRRRFRDVLDGRAYPVRLAPRQEGARRPRRTHRVRLDGPSALRDYSLPSLVLLFFLFSFTGWVWEVSIHLVRDGVFVDRGVLHGPWLPIYGVGGLLILVLLARLRDRPLAEFGAAVVLCGAVEYVTSWALETLYGLKWWDYTGYLLNLNGRICAEGLLTFGVFGLVIVYVVAPALDDLIRRWRLGVAVPVCLVLLTAFAADGLWSLHHPNTGQGITDYGGTASVVQADTGGSRTFTQETKSAGSCRARLHLSENYDRIESS